MPRYQMNTGKTVPVTGNQTISFNPEDALILGTDEFAVTTFNSDYPVLGTVGASQCIILTVYDPTQKKALVAHISALSPEKLKTLADALSPLHKTNAAVYITGGMNNATSRLTIVQLKTMLALNGIKFFAEDICRFTLKKSASVAIDTRDGSFYTDVTLDHFDNTLERLVASAYVPLGELSRVSEQKASSIAPKDSDNHALERLQARVGTVVAAYNKHNKGISFCLFHYHGKTGRVRATQFERDIRNCETLESAQQKVAAYLSNTKNGNTHPHSFRTMLLHSFLSAKDVSKNLSLEDVSQNFKNYQFV